MSDTETHPGIPVKEALDQREYFRLSTALKERTARAAAKLGLETHADITVDAYIRGAVEKRNNEVLNGAEERA
jgi:hypothetical protein